MYKNKIKNVSFYSYDYQSVIIERNLNSHFTVLPQLCPSKHRFTVSIMVCHQTGTTSNFSKTANLNRHKHKYQNTKFYLEVKSHLKADMEIVSIDGRNKCDKKLNEIIKKMHTHTIHYRFLYSTWRKSYQQETTHDGEQGSVLQDLLFSLGLLFLSQKWL